MTITVRSNDVAETPEADAKLGETASIEPKSAPGTKEAQEQNEAEDSDSLETEGKEVEDESEDSESEEDSEKSEDPEKDKPKKKGGFQRRIDKLNSRYTAAQQELEYWKSQATKSVGESKKEPVQAKTEVQEGKPNPDHYDTHMEYVEALTDYKLEQREKSKAEEAQRSKLETEQQKIVQDYRDRAKAFSKVTEDFQEVLESVDDIRAPAAVTELILSSENGPALAYALAKDREEYERICSLPPLAAARAIGRIESKLSPSEESKTEPKKITKAPRPLDPVGSGTRGAMKKSLNDPNLTQAEYEQLRREQIKRKNG